MEQKSISFGFSKKLEKSNVGKSEISDEVEISEETDYVTSLEGRTIKSIKPKEEKKEIIIPLIKTNNWKTNHVNKTQTDKPPPPAAGIDSQAISEILQDTAKQLDSWQTQGTVDPNIEIPLLMQNQVPEGYETDERLDVSLRPDGPEDTDYDEVPIEAFGVAMLKGMGWKPGQGIGKNNKLKKSAVVQALQVDTMSNLHPTSARAIAPVEAVLRPKGMGLGADRKQAQSLNTAKQGGNSKHDDDTGELSMKKGAFCLIENGPHKDLYAVIEGMDEDNARLMLKLTVSGKLVTVSQYNTKLVSKNEYYKYSKYINKGAADRYREKEESKKKNKDSDRESDSHREKKHRKEDERLSGEDDRQREKHDREKDKYKEQDRSSRKRKHEEERSHHKTSSSHTNGSNTSQTSLWVRPKLRVRLVDKQYKRGKYYNSKIVIVDVFDRDHCVCKTDEGKVLEDIPQSVLETLVPKTDSPYVCIVSGKYKGQLGQVLERDKKKCEALVQLLSDRDKLIPLHYDSICEYVGDINEEFDF